MTAQFTLNPDQRGDLERLIRAGSVKDWSGATAALAERIEASISAWSAARDMGVTAQGLAHLSRLVKLLTSSGAPKIGLIRTRVAALPPGIVREIEGRASRLSLTIDRFRPLGFGLKAWAKTAPPDALVSLLRSCLFQGGQLVPGRNRPGGKQSAPRLEPLILSRGKARQNDDVKAGGRPSEDDLRLLISFLAIDWLLSKGLQPDKGRSDHTAFGDLVFMVFQWIGEEEKAAHSLRTYWYPPKPRPKEMPSAALSQG
ncbi:MAG: hypothetical protein WCO04_12530 [Pseudomonadota bacterium]